MRRKMNFFKTIVILCIISFLMGVQLPPLYHAWETRAYAKADMEKDITKHPPEFLSPPEQRIPVTTQKPVKAVEKPKKHPWLWVGLGVLAAGVLAGAGGGGGGGGDDGGSPSTGDITVQWNE
jgi:hypothetical protein